MLTKSFFINNRNKLIKHLEDNSVVVLSSGRLKQKSLDQSYPFTVNRNFYYETGINEANDIFVLSKINDKVSVSLFIAEIDEVKARWVGRTLTKEEASAISGIEDIYYLDEFDSYLDNLLSEASNLYFDLELQKINEVMKYDPFINDLYNKYSSKVSIKDCYKILAIHRMKKEKEEVELVKKAIEITKSGIELLMKNAKSGIYEYELEAYFDYEIKRLGASDFAFKTIAGSGKNGAILHYEDNNSLIEKGSLILFDLGAQYKLYNADITRTFPVDGKFSPRQKEIYEIVLRGQDLVISKVRPGITLIELNNILINFYEEELTKIGLIKEKEELKKYYFHGVSHHLGLDTHDAAFRNMPLVEGAIITVEPGLYIEEESIGIRIQNDVLVTSEGCIDLASDIIKTVEDIENYMK